MFRGRPDRGARDEERDLATVTDDHGTGSEADSEEEEEEVSFPEGAEVASGLAQATPDVEGGESDGGSSGDDDGDSSGDDDDEDDVDVLQVEEEDFFGDLPSGGDSDSSATALLPTRDIAERIAEAVVEDVLGTTEAVSDAVVNSDEVVSLVNDIDSSQIRYERLRAERAAAIARDPHNAMDSDRIARVNRHFLSRVLPSMRESFIAFMLSDWYTHVDSSLNAPCRMITLIEARLQELSCADEEPSAAEGRVAERVVTICGNSESNNINLMTVFTALNSEGLLPISGCVYPDISASFPAAREEEATEFPFSDPDIVTAANRVLLSLRFRLLQEIITSAREASAMGLDADGLPLSVENIEWLEQHRIIVAIGEIDTRGLNLDGLDGDRDSTIAAYIYIHNRIIERSREILLTHPDCSAISAYRNFDFAMGVLGQHGNPFDPNDTRHAFTVNTDLIGVNNRSAAEHVQVLAAFYYLVAIDPAHPDTDRMRWMETVGQLADIRNTYGPDRASCYPGAVCRVARFSGNHPELALPDTLLNFVQVLGRSIISNAISSYFELLRDADYETRRNAYLALITFSSFNAEAIRVHELTEIMGQSLTLLFYVRDDFLSTSLPLSVGDFIAQIEREVEVRYPGSSLSALERALAHAIFYNFSDSACLSIRSNFQHTLAEDERERFIAEDAETDHRHFQVALASSESTIYSEYLSVRESLDEEYDSIVTHEQFLDLIHREALEQVRENCLSRFGIAEHLAEQEIRDQSLTAMYRRSAEQLLRLRAHNSSVTWSDDEINSRVLGQISRNNRSLWFACSRPPSGEIPECDEDTSDYSGESLQQASIRLLLQSRFVAEPAPVSLEPIQNNAEVLRLARSIQAARSTYENRNRSANLAAASDSESSMRDSMLQIGISHFHGTMFPHLRGEYRRYTLSSWLDLLDDELSDSYRRHEKIKALIANLESGVHDHPIGTGGEFGEEQNFTFLRSIGAIRDTRVESLDEERERIVEVADDGDTASSSGEIRSTPESVEEYSLACILALYERLLGIDTIDLPDVTEGDVEVDLELDEDGDLDLVYSDDTVIQVTNRILLMLKSKILDEIISEAGSASSFITSEVGSWLRANRNIILLGEIDEIEEGTLLPDELRSYVFTHNAIVSQARRLLGSISCDSVNAWNCLDIRVSLAEGSYAHPFNPSATRGTFISSRRLMASGQAEAAHQARAMLSVICLNAFEQGEHADLSGARFAGIIGQLSDILNANGLRRASCYPGAIGRILKMADGHPVIAMPTDVPTFITNVTRGILVPRTIEYFQGLQVASYSRARDAYLALMSFSSFYVDSILDQSMCYAMGVPLNRLIHAWNDVRDSVLLGDPENICGQVRHEVSQTYNEHQLNQREEALLAYYVTDISPLIASAIRDAFLRTITPEDRLRFLQAEQEDGDDIYTCTEGQQESEIYTHYTRLYREAIREFDGDEAISRAIFRDIFNQVVDRILEIPSVQSMEVTRERVVSEIRDYRLQDRFSSIARLMLSLRERSTSLEGFTNERIANRVVRDIANEELSLWFNCRQNREDRNESDEDDFSLGSDPIEVAAMRLRLRQRFIEESVVTESRPITPVRHTESSLLRDHIRQAANFRAYVFPEGRRVAGIPVSCATLGMNYSRISNVAEVNPYSHVLHLPALPVILPYHPTGRTHGTRGGSVTRVFMALDTNLGDVDFSSPDFASLVRICRDLGVSTSLDSYDISCSVVVEDYGFLGREDMLVRAHPWLHPDAPQTGGYNRISSISVASIINRRVRIISESDVHTHGSQRSSSSSVVFSPNNMHVWTPSESEFSDGALRENKFITTVFVESSGVGDARPRLKIVTTLIVTQTTALALDRVLMNMRTSSSEAINGILTRGNFAEILTYIDSEVSGLYLRDNLPLDAIRTARFGAEPLGSERYSDVVRYGRSGGAGASVALGVNTGAITEGLSSRIAGDTDSPPETSRPLTRHNAFRFPSGSRSRQIRGGRVFNYDMPAGLEIPDSDLAMTLSRELRIDSRVSYLGYNRLTNVGSCNPYGRTLSLPRLPMLHPYNPNGSEALIRIDNGLTRVLIAAEINVSVDRFNIAGIFGSSIGDLSGVPVTTSVVVQNCPFNRNTHLLGRAHPWLHPDAPETGNWSRQDTVRFAIIGDDRVRIYLEGSVHTHGHSEQEAVVFSPNNFRSITVGEDGLSSNMVYATVFAVMEGGRVSRLAVTTHVLLTDTDTESLSTAIDDYLTTGLVLTEERLLALLNSITDFSPDIHMPWGMVARGALAVQSSTGMESLPVAEPLVVTHAADSLPDSSNLRRRRRPGDISLLRRLPRGGQRFPSMRRNQASELGVVNIIPEEFRELRVEAISESGEVSAEVLTNLQLFSNPDLGGRSHFIMPVMARSHDEISHPLVAVTYSRGISPDRLPEEITNWLESFCRSHGYDCREMAITLNFCLQQQESGMMFSLSQSMQSADQSETMISILNEDGSHSEHRIGVGDFDIGSTRIEYTGTGSTAYSCIIFPSSGIITLTLHLLLPEGIYSSLASAISRRDQFERRLVTTRLEHLLVYLRGNVPEEHIEIFEDFSMLHRLFSREFHASIASGVDLARSASNVDFSIVNMGEMHPNVLARQAPIIYSIREPLVPICLHLPVADMAALPAYVHRFISMNRLSEEDVDVDVFFVAQSNPYIRGETSSLSLDSLINPSCQSATLSSVINPRSDEAITVHRNASTGNFSFEILVNEGVVSFETLTLIRSGNDRDRLVLTMHCLTPMDMARVISDRIEASLSELPSASASQPDVHMLSAIVDNLHGICPIHENLTNFANIVYSIIGFPGPGEIVEDAFINTEIIPCYMQQFFNESELRLRPDRYREDFIRFCVRAMPSAQSVIGCVERLIELLAEEDSFFTLQVIENAIRYGNSIVLRELYRHGVNIVYPEIGGHGPIALCIDLGHDDCAALILEAARTIPSSYEVLDEEAVEYLRGLGLEDRLRAVQMRGRAMAELPVSSQREPLSPMLIEDITSEDCYEGVMRNLFQYIMHGDLANFQAQYDVHVEALADRMFLGNSLVTFCAEQGQIEILEYLCSHGANVDMARVSDNRTAMHIAADRGNNDMIRRIVAISTSSRSMRDAMEQTPVQIYQLRYPDGFTHALFRTEEEIAMSSSAVLIGAIVTPGSRATPGSFA